MADGITQVRETFARLRAQRRKALIPFVMAGDPSLAGMADLLPALEDAGADLIEVGVPFSDPLADGPVIQAASARALAAQVTPRRVLDTVAAVRRRLSAPVVCLSYWNPIVQFGSPDRSLSPNRFVRAARASGVSGLIVPDLPVEEGDMLRRAGAQVGLATIFLAAPTSSGARLRAIASRSEGFIYYVSVTGTTGARRRLPPALTDGVRELKVLTSKPVCVGFGISTPGQAASVAAIADGVIVGSALIEAVRKERGRRAQLVAAKTFLARLRRAV